MAQPILKERGPFSMSLTVGVENHINSKTMPGIDERMDFSFLPFELTSPTNNSMNELV